ncbi:hypothetical protein LTR37_009762 [Vermiconidia calcicola]|uniref:Uncharacterized protein n=1 Tax=Vermiconidia calcicola TaxID=1690605 RepID=A0ACC3N6H6_9PEZI|nr:hypothetical protein LTR37_009762 [Vermiconidia calcicola]
MKRQKQELEAQHHRIADVMDQLRHKTEAEALDMFRRIRQGEYDKMLEAQMQSREDDPSFQPQPAESSSSGEQRLPPISTMFEVSDQAQSSVDYRGSGTWPPSASYSEGSAGSPRIDRTTPQNSNS